MNAEERRLTERFLEDALGAEELEDLFRRLRASDEFADEFADLLRIGGLLSSAYRGDRRSDDLVRTVRASLGPDQTPGSFEARVMRGLDQSARRSPEPARRPPTRRGRPFPGTSGPSGWRIALLAASAVLGVGLILAVYPSRPPSHAPVGVNLKAPVAAPEGSERQKARLEGRVKELEREVAERQREQERLKELRDRAAGQQKQEELRAAEAELAKAAEAFRARAEELARAKREEGRIREASAKRGEPSPQEASPSEKPGTEATVATLAEVLGEVFVLSKNERTPAKAGLGLRAGQGLETAPGASWAVVSFPDETRVYIPADTVVREIGETRGKRMHLERSLEGIRPEVSKQPKDRPMVFSTPHGEATVLGTTLRLVVDPDPKKGTKLVVEEGRVELKNLAGKTVMVESGHFAVAAVGVELKADVMRVPEVVLRPHLARIVGREWRSVPDQEASTGFALEAPESRTAGLPGDDTFSRFREGSLGYVEFRFLAEPSREYTVWVRGRDCAPTGADRSWHDKVIATLPGGGRFSRAFDGLPPQDRNIHHCAFAGFGYHDGRKGYWWVGGSADQGPDGIERDIVPATVRFPRPGLQTLRLYPFEAPMRIDAVWLSTTQKKRPAADLYGPAAERK